MSAHKNKGFTLIELLITISILAILATIGMVTYRNVTKNARDTVKKADMQAIAKAYESQYTGLRIYPTLAPTDFSNGIPSLMSSNAFNCIKGPGCTDDTGDTFAICANLDSDTPCYSSSNSCYCLSAVQGTSATGGGGSGEPSSCDPYGALSQGLVGYWKMDEAPGASIANDSSGDNNNGSLVNGAAIITASHTQSFPTDLSANFNNAANFNGESQYISVPYKSSLTPSRLTLSFWLKTIEQTTASNWNGVLGGAGGSGYSQGIRFLDYNNRLGWQINFGDASPIFGYATGTLPVGQWIHIALSYDGQNVKIYRNGQPSTPVAETRPINWVTSGNLTIGFAQFGFNGQLDDIRVYNRALTSSEVATLFNSGNGCLP